MQGKIFNTTNGGTDWTEQLGGAGTTKLTSVYFVDNNTGWACGWEGRIVKTSNGGEDWDFSFSGTPNSLTGLFAFDNENVWTVGSLGAILKLDTSTIGVEEYTYPPSNLELIQNYPNPFNSETNIRFTLTKFDQVNLSIFNMLGQNVATLVNEKLSAGTYDYSFNGEYLASGIYLYKITTGSGYSQVKKMIFLK